MRQDKSIQQLSTFDAKLLIDEFNRRASSRLKDVTELVEVYAIFIAISFKEPHQVRGFFEEALKITFDWFGRIAELYLSDYNPYQERISIGADIGGFKPEIRVNIL